VIHGCDPNKYKPGEIVEILPSDPKASPEWRILVNKLRQEIIGSAQEFGEARI